MTTGVLPNLLIIGAAKCGTTSLHNYLNAHPDIAMANVKELDFFVDNGTWNRGIDWYRQNFSSYSKIRGESSTSYTRADNAGIAAHRIHELVPEASLIYMVRDPLDRIRSDYHQLRTSGVEERSLEVALEDPDNPYVAASSYGTQLAPYIELFGLSRILVETQENLLAERRECLRRVFSFLEVDDSVDLVAFDRLWNQSDGKGWAYSLGLKIRRRGIRLPRPLRWPAQRLQRSKVLGGAGNSRPPDIDGETRSHLIERLQPEVRELEELTGATFDGWLSSGPTPPRL